MSESEEAITVPREDTVDTCQSTLYFRQASGPPEVNRIVLARLLSTGLPGQESSGRIHVFCRSVLET